MYEHFAWPQPRTLGIVVPDEVCDSLPAILLKNTSMPVLAFTMFKITMFDFSM